MGLRLRRLELGDLGGQNNARFPGNDQFCFASIGVWRVPQHHSLWEMLNQWASSERPLKWISQEHT
jgi:hypothetical protein